MDKQILRNFAKENNMILITRDTESGQACEENELPCILLDNDEIFKSRVYKEGNPKEEGDLHHQKMINSRFADASKLAWYLDKIGQSSLHWQKIVKKESPLLMNANHEPFLQNACCNTGDYKTLDYFIKKDSSIKTNDDIISYLYNINFLLGGNLI